MSILRVGIIVLLAGAGIGTIAVMSLPACSDIPSKTCRADLVNAYVKDGEADASVDCTQCLQTHTDCCDAVGFCGESDLCKDEVRDAQACVIKNGPRNEAKCTTNLVDDVSQTLYACMRKNCGDQCAIPSCTLDNSVILFGTARCDRCASSACCSDINTCYQDRACKLTLECVITKCAGNLGEGMRALVSSPTALDVTTDAICNNNPGAGGAGGVGNGGLPQGGPTECIFSCLNDFAPQDGGTEEDRVARCNSFKVYACTARSGCGDECLPDDVADSGIVQPIDAASRD